MIRILSADLKNSACGRYKKQLKRVKPIKLADWVFFLLYNFE
jgi:hypothetical protein